MFTKVLSLGLVSLIIFAANAWAGLSTIEGTVKDANGHVLKGADLRIEGKGNLSKTLKTDASGHYISGDLPAGTYQVTLLVNGAIKASIKNANVKLAERTQLNFNLKTEAGAQGKKKSTHMVYVPGETGSHLGGRWVEVDDSGKADVTGADNVQKADGTAIRKLQNTSTGGASAMGAGH